MSADRLSPQDASFLHIEDDVSHMHIASVAIFEGPQPPFDDVVAMVEAKLDLVPRYRQVVRFVPFDLGRPVWVDDPHFNIEYHLRHTALPTPGGEAELRKLVGRVMAQQLDRSKPLWEIWVVEGLEDGRWAMLSKTHHAMVDGVSGTDLLAVIMDLSPRAPTGPTGAPVGPRARPSRPRAGRRRPAEHGPQPLRAGPGGPGLDPGRAPPGSARPRRWPAGWWPWPDSSGPTPPRASTARSAPTGATRGPPPRSRTSRRCASALGGTFNDVVLASITNGFRELLLSRGEDVDRVVRTLVPVSVRPRDASGKAVGDGTFENKVSAMFAELPVDIEDPIQRLHVITEQMEDLKDSKQAVAGEALTSMSGFAPPMLLALGMRLATRAAQRNVNTVTTNVPGPQFPLYAAGRRMVRPSPTCPWAARSASAWPSSPTTARSTSASPATTTRPPTSTCWPAASRTVWPRCARSPADYMRPGADIAGQDQPVRKPGIPLHLASI